MDTARFGGAEHLGDGPGGVVAPGHDRGWQACARRRLAPAPKRNGVVADFPSERVSARGQGAGWPGTERLAMVSGNRGLGDADLSRHSGIEEMLLAAALYGTAGAHRPSPDFLAVAPVRRWRMEPRLGAVAGLQLGFLPGDHRAGSIGVGGHGRGQAGGQLSPRAAVFTGATVLGWSRLVTARVAGSPATSGRCSPFYDALPQRAGHRADLSGGGGGAGLQRVSAVGQASRPVQ